MAERPVRVRRRRPICRAVGANDTFAPWKFSNPWFGTLRGRAGYAFNNILLYGTLGLAYGDLKGEFGGAAETQHRWRAGPAASVRNTASTPNWSAKVEYLYMDLADRGFAITGMDNGYRANMVRFGVNYHF